MGRDLFAAGDRFFLSLVEAGSEYVDADLRRVCLKGPDTTLRLARFVQPLLASVCLGYFARLREAGVKPDFVLGHSLGEITSLGAAGVVPLEDAVRIAAKRGALMDEAAEQCRGGMMAVMMVSREDVQRALEQFGAGDDIVLANDNAAHQVVVSGEIAAMDGFAEYIREKHQGKCRHLPIAGPWHSHCLDQAREKFREWVRLRGFSAPATALVMNATARCEDNPAVIKDRCTAQLTSPVYWRQSMATLAEEGVDTLIEIGPGRVLAGLARVNGFKRGNRVLTVGNLKGVETVSRLCAVQAPLSSAQLEGGGK